MRRCTPFADSAIQDIWYDTRTDDGGFDTDVGVVDEAQTQWLAGSLVYADGTGRRFLYETGPHGDNEGIIRYDEHPLP